MPVKCLEVRDVSLVLELMLIMNPVQDFLKHFSPLWDGSSYKNFTGSAALADWLLILQYKVTYHLFLE